MASAGDANNFNDTCGKLRQAVGGIVLSDQTCTRHKGLWERRWRTPANRKCSASGARKTRPGHLPGEARHWVVIWRPPLQVLCSLAVLGGSFECSEALIDALRRIATKAALDVGEQPLWFGGVR